MALARAEWVRFSRRGSNKLIVVAVPLLAAFIFVAGYASLYDPGPAFDPEATRARVIAEGYLEGVPPEDFETILADIIESERVSHEQSIEQLAISRAKFAFPQSLVTLLGSGTFVFFALILLTATSIGDEFGWGTIRTSLVASSHRLRMLSVRLLALALVASVMFALLLLLGAILPVLLAIAGAPLPSGSPIDAGALLVLLVGQLLISTMVVAFAALVTLIVRSGSLTLVAVLVYFLVETAAIGLLMRFPAFQYDGANAWLLDAFPVRAIFTLSDVASRAAAGLPTYVGEAIVRDLSAARVPFVAMLVMVGLFATLAFRRFSRMDIVE